MIQTEVSSKLQADLQYANPHVRGQPGADHLAGGITTVGHPLQTERDAENYNAVLGQMSMRMDEAIALSAATKAC
jgi:hypothetical protein